MTQASESEAFETLDVEQVGQVMVVRFNRPHVSNAINTRMGRELLSLWDRLNARPDSCRAVILTGAGERAFCAGGDLKERNGMSDDEWLAQHLVFERMVRAFLSVPMPIIATVNGAAFGGGCEFALCCDFIYASTNARFALTEVTLGIMPGSGGTQTLPRAVGERRAKELIFTGGAFSAEEAHLWGMVNRLCAPEQLLDEALATATRIAANAPLAVRQAKHSVQTGLQMDFKSALMFEIEAYNRLPMTEDRREGVSAFNERRPPRFTGR
jgi:enoyl-CoA hydratase/carnithine racemase